MTNNEEIPAVVDVTISVPIDKLLGSYTERLPRYTGDPDDMTEPPDNVTQAITHHVALLIVNQIGKDVRKEVKSKIDSILREKLEAEVDKVLAGNVQRTTEWGEAVGTPKTLREMAIETSQKWLSEPTDRYNRDKGTRADVYIKKIVDEAISTDLREALNTARAQTTALLQQRAAEAMAETIAKMAK
jgi:hypothetical protein